MLNNARRDRTRVLVLQKPASSIRYDCEVLTENETAHECEPTEFYSSKNGSTLGWRPAQPRNPPRRLAVHRRVSFLASYNWRSLDPESSRKVAQHRLESLAVIHAQEPGTAMGKRTPYGGNFSSRRRTPGANRSSSTLICFATMLLTITGHGGVSSARRPAREGLPSILRLVFGEQERISNRQKSATAIVLRPWYRTGLLGALPTAASEAVPKVLAKP